MVKIIFNLYIKQRSADLFCRYFIFYHYIRNRFQKTRNSEEQQEIIHRDIRLPDEPRRQ